MTIVRLKYMSGRTTEQEPGRILVAEGDLMYLSPRAFQFISHEVVTCAGNGLTENAAAERAFKDLGATDAEIRRYMARGLHLVVDYDIVDNV